MTCPCGYDRECEFWCGPGHGNGQCPALDTMKVIPECPTCGPFRIESHPRLTVVRCANCKEWLA